MNPSILPPRRRRALAGVALLVSCILVATAGGATAAMRFEAKRRNVLLPGAGVGGVPLGGLTIAEARLRLTQEFQSPLDRVFVVEAGGRYFTTTPRRLGVATDALDRLREAVSRGGSLPPLRRAWHRLTGVPIGTRLDVETSFDSDRLNAFAEQIAAEVDRPPKDAVIRLVGEGLRIDAEEAGFALDRTAAIEAIRAGVLSGKSSARLDGEFVAPRLRRSDFTDVLVIKAGENKLYHYRGETVLKVYDVATGRPDFPTPKGQFRIVNKRYRPTWGNPAKYPGGWGWKLPASIPPGPGNPLGTRALDLSAPGIRIHGTYASHSIGYNASHGCIRMRIADAEELFERVRVGTPVLIVQEGRYRPLYERSRSGGAEPTAESDATPVPGQAPPAEPGGGGGEPPPIPPPPLP